MKNICMYKIISCDNEVITLQVNNKITIFTINWQEIFLNEYIVNISKNQLFYLGTYYTHNMRNKNLHAKLSRDTEVSEIKKMLLTEIRGGNYIVLDIKTSKLETISLKFILANLHLLEDFTSLQCFYLGTRAGAFYDKSNFK